MLIDFHCHVLPPSFPERHREICNRDATFAALFTRGTEKMATADGLIAAMDSAGVDHAVICGFGWSNPDVAREVNDYIIDSACRFPSRLTGFCSVSPLWPGDQATEEVRRCAAAGLKGIGELHPDLQGFDVSDYATMRPLMNLAHSLGLVTLIHTSEPVGHIYPGKGRTTPELAYRFIKNFPDNTIVCAHWGGGLPFYGLMPEVPGELENAYFDTAVSPFLYRREIFDTVPHTIGAQKILFGTDFPLIGHRRLLDQIEESSLNEEERRAILGGNACRLLGLAD